MRTRTVIKAGVFCLAALAGAVGLSISATNTNVRADLTLSRQHQISERTSARLRALSDPIELVIAVARDRLDPRDADRVDDVLAALDDASPNFAVTLIDVTGPRGADEFESLVERLEARDAPMLQAHADASETARTELSAMRWDLTSLDAAATAAARAADSSDRAVAQRLGEFAAFARITNTDAGKTLETQVTDRSAAAAQLRTLAELGASLAAQFEQIQTELGSMALPPRARSRSAEAARLAASLRARAETIAALAPEPTDLDRVAEAIATGEAALLIGPPRTDGTPGVVALDLAGFYPSPTAAALRGQANGGGEADARVRAEQLVASGLAVLADDDRPIVVFMHGESQRFVGRAGVLTALLERLGKAGIDHAEWPVVLDDAPPPLDDLDPRGTRPRVYAVISPDSAAPSNPNDPNSTPGTGRAAKVASAVQALLDRGEPVLLGMNPSVFPTFGDADPFAALLEPLGVVVRSANPVLSEANTAMGPATAWNIRVIPNIREEDRASANPIAIAADGLPLALEWPIPMDVAPRAERPADTTIEALLTLDIPGAWSESEWLGYWRTPRAQRALLRDPPMFDEDADIRGPFSVALAIEHQAATGPARLVAMGSNTWFLDRVWQGQQTIAGRGVLTNPGNPEFFDAAVLWLAGRDDLIAPSSAARPIARIAPISENGLVILRWSIIGGLPALVLIVGAGWRLFRG